MPELITPVIPKAWLLSQPSSGVAYRTAGPGGPAFVDASEETASEDGTLVSSDKNIRPKNTDYDDDDPELQFKLELD